MTTSFQKYYEDACGVITRRNFRSVSVAVARLEIIGAPQSYLAHCYRTLALKQVGSALKGTRLHAHGEEGLQRMKIQRMIKCTQARTQKFLKGGGVWHRWGIPLKFAIATMK